MGHAEDRFIAENPADFSAVLRKYDFAWSERQLPSEPVSGMSESLAEGLVSRFVQEWTRAELYHFARRPIPLTQKRAAAYRRFCKWLDGAIPPSLKILKTETGRQDGSDKGASREVFYFAVDPAGKWLIVAVDIVTAKAPVPSTFLILSISRHALVRLFQRLKTTDPEAVLAELRRGIRCYWIHAELHKLRLPRPDILVPTLTGALAIAADTSGGAHHTAVVAKTWISDTRMTELGSRLRAVQTARREAGVVLMVNGRFVVVSEQRMKHDVTLAAFTDCINAQLQIGGDTASPTEEMANACQNFSIS